MRQGEAGVTGMRDFASFGDMDPAESAGKTDYAELARRMGEDLLRKRIEKQAEIWAKETHQGSGIFALERFVPVDAIIWFLIRAVGLGGVGRRNFLNVPVIEREVWLRDLPQAFEGFRLLQLSDLHCDLDPALTGVVVDRLRSTKFDYVVFTGDFHNRIGEEHTLSLAQMRRLIQETHGRCVGILGNHDFIEKVAFLESCGLPILLNEHTVVERGGSRMVLCGVDDPHFFRTDAIDRALEGVGDHEFKILLAHSPEISREAAEAGFAYYMCGHTHAGQICLPGGRLVVRNARCRDELFSGFWMEGEMPGFTSPGTGASGVPARFHCPGEITVHILRRA